MQNLLLGISLLFGLGMAQNGAPALRGSTMEVSALSSASLDSVARSIDQPYLLERQGRRHLVEGGMQPLSCNVQYSTCVNWSSLFGTSNRHTEVVTIPCGSCVRMNHAADTLRLDGGLDIQGKLIFPESVNGLTLYSSMIVVQGELEMSSITRPIDGTPRITFVMTGNTNRFYTPIGENENYCDGPVCPAGKKGITVAGGRVNIRGAPASTKTWVNLYDVVASGQSATAIVVPRAGVQGAWSVGASILITSHTKMWHASFDTEENQQGQQVRHIAGIAGYSGDASYVTLTLDQPIVRPTTALDDARFAVEVALLSRNIVFEGGPDNEDHHGGHFWIYETNAHQQLLEGVEFVNFGQAGTLGRYPIHAHLCGDLSGSVFAKNTIRESNQRCIVVHGSDNLLVEDNVAFDTAGHCFMLEDGVERGNQFIGNLGAHTRVADVIIPDSGLNGIETDHQPATFWIPALDNAFVGNVAAGSVASGYWFEPLKRGPLKDSYAGLIPSEQNIERFEDNVAHSNGLEGVKTYPKAGLRPITSMPNTFKNLKVYRNFNRGVFVFFAWNLIIEGGIFADNDTNLDFDKNVNVHVYDAEIIGESEIYASQYFVQNFLRICFNGGNIVGIQQVVGDSGAGEGITGVNIHSASFSGFPGTRCVHSSTPFPMRLGESNRAMSIAGIPTIGGGGNPADYYDFIEDNYDDPVARFAGLNPDGPNSPRPPSPTAPMPSPPSPTPPSPTPPSPTSGGLYVNCGSGNSRTVDGVAWVSDQYLQGSGNMVRIASVGSTPLDWYTEERSSGTSLVYVLPVADGKYDITLGWSNYFYFASNERRTFDILINGTPERVDYDVRLVADRADTVELTFSDVQARNGEGLRIELKGTREKAYLSYLQAV